MVSFIKRCGQNLWCFLTVFLTCSVLQSMINTFLTSAIQSIERQFQIPSKKSGTLISASRVGYIPTILFLAYFGSKGNRAKWIGAGSLIMALGCFLAALPNFVFPSKPVFTNLDTNFVLNAVMRPTGNISRIDEILDNPVIGHRIPVGLQAVMAEYEELDDFNSSFPLDKYFVGDQYQVVQNETIKRKSNTSFRMNLADKLSLYFPANLSYSLMKQAQLPFGYCNSTVMKLKNAVKDETCKRRKSESSYNEIAFAMIFIAITLFGVGQSLPSTLGTPLIDDSVKRKSAPFFFAAIRSIRIMGPIIGLWMGAGCFKLYVTLKDPPGLSPTDPRWIGAWWLGFLIIGVLLIFPSLLLFFYPDVKFIQKKDKADEEQTAAEKALLEKAKEANEKPLIEHKPRSRLNSVMLEKQKTRFVDEVRIFSSSVFLCLKSPIFIGVLLGRLFDVFAFRGLSSFQSKFIENHYGIPQHQVSFFSGVVGGLSYAGGIILGSLIMRKFKLDGRRAAAYVMLCSFLSIVLTMSKVFLKCQSINNAVGELAVESNFNLTSSCNQNCLCDTSSLYPVCDRNGQPFFSPCHAGCSNFTLDLDDSTNTVFSNCECVNYDSRDNSRDVSRDFCISDCTVPLYLYYAITVATGIIAGTAGISHVLISLRCVPHEVRSVSIAFSGFLVSLLSSAPSPIIVGSVIDSACLIWNNACGRQGACLLYDAAALRIRIHSMYGILRATGLLFDVWVWYWAANLLLLKENNDNKKGKKKSKSSVVGVDSA